MVMHSKPAGHKNETAKSCYEEINKLICKFARENLSVLKELEKLGEPVGHSDYSVSVSSRVEPSPESGLRQLGQQKSLEQKVQCQSSLSVVPNSNVERKKKRNHDSKKNRHSVREQKKREHRKPRIDRSRSSVNSRRQLPAISPDSSILERKSVELKSLRSETVSSPIGSVRSNSDETVSTNMSRLFLSPTSSYVLLKKPEKTCTRRSRVACGCRCHSECLVCANEKYARQSPNMIHKEITRGMERYVKLGDTSTLSFKSTSTSEKSRRPEPEKTCTRRTRVASGCRCQSKQCLVCANEKYARQSPKKIQKEIARGMERYVKLGDTSTLSWKSISTSESTRPPELRLSSNKRSSDHRKVDNEDGIVIQMTDKNGKKIDVGFDAKMLITEKGRQTNRLCISTNLTNGTTKWVEINGQLLWL